MNELTHRGAVYGKGSGYGALGDALAVQLQHFEVASVTLLAPRSLLALISGGKHRLRTFGQRMADQLRLGDVFRGLVHEVVMTIHKAFDHLAHVLEQMPPIGYLHRLWGSLTCSIRIRCAPIAAYELDLWMIPQPIGKARCLSIGQKVKGFVVLKIDQHGAVSLTLAKCPIVYAQHPHLGGARKGSASDLSQQRIAAGEQSQLLGDPSSRSSSKSEPDERKRSLEAIGLTGISSRLRHPLGEDGSLTGRILAE